MNDLDNKIIIVTGGSGLIGSEIVSDIINRGAVAINVDLYPKKNNEYFTNIKCDIRSSIEISKAVKKIIKDFGRIDGLVNNAYPKTKDWSFDFEKMSSKSFLQNLDWQLNSYITFCREVIKPMKGFSRVSIVNIASIYGIRGNDFRIYEGSGIEPPAAYSAIKGGIINITRFLASKYGRFGIRVNCLSPGGVYDGQSRIFVDNYCKRVPLGRMALPEDIAPAVSFLLSDNSKYITGHNLIIDGGWTAI